MSKPNIVPTHDGSGRMLDPEPVNFAGLTEFGDVYYLQKGLSLLLCRYCTDALENGVQLSTEEATQLHYVSQVLDAAVDYCHDYLTRRVHALEEELGLKPCADIDIFRPDDTSESD